MRTGIIKATNLSIRINREAEGEWCSGCGEVQAEYQPEIFIRTDYRFRFLCKLCAWDHAPWLVSLINMGHYSKWESWGGKPPTTQMLKERGLLVADMVGEKEKKPADKPDQTTDNHHEVMLSAYINAGEDNPFANISTDSPTWGQEVARSLENRRREIRYSISIPAKLRVKEKGLAERMLVATTFDVSSSGTFLILDEQLEEGTKVSMQLPFPAMGLLLAAGTVVRTDEGGVGVAFNKTQWKNKKAFK